jgi:hypothetical protein
VCIYASGIQALGMETPFCMKLTDIMCSEGSSFVNVINNFSLKQN